jgi:tRNA/tmRNA/rRNA uracil-C5-methylase (TrmA/RlmC/RlmD family)
MEREVEIARLGPQGDGVAEGFDGPLYVPFALPGERVRVAVAPGDDRAELLVVLRARTGSSRSALISAFAAGAPCSTWTGRPISIGNGRRWSRP